jgi:hypothetical protein
MALPGAALVAAIAVASLVPADMQVRTGLHWLVEHFVIFFAATLILCRAWPRPLVVAGWLIPFSALMEAAQALTLDRTPDLPTALFGAAGVASAALLADLVIQMRKRRKTGVMPGRNSPGRALAQPE